MFSLEIVNWKVCALSEQIDLHYLPHLYQNSGITKVGFPPRPSDYHVYCGITKLIQCLWIVLCHSFAKICFTILIMSNMVDLSNSLWLDALKICPSLNSVTYNSCSNPFDALSIYCFISKCPLRLAIYRQSSYDFLNHFLFYMPY